MVFITLFHFSLPQKTVVLLAIHTCGFHKCFHLIRDMQHCCKANTHIVVKDQNKKKICFSLKGIIHSCSNKGRHFKEIIL